MKPGDRVRTNRAAQAAGILDRAGVLVGFEDKGFCAVVRWDGFVSVRYIGAHLVEPEEVV